MFTFKKNNFELKIDEKFSWKISLFSRFKLFDIKSNIL